MSLPREHPPVKLVASLIFASREKAGQAVRLAVEAFGATDGQSGEAAFDWTDYYRRELGAPLFRRFVSFEKLVRREALAEAKSAANRVEARLGTDGRRTVNIDPGFVSAENLTLATCKSAGHRVLVRDGVFADVQLLFHRGRFAAMPWTYPDYGSAEVRSFFEGVRLRYLDQLAMSEEVKA